MLRLFCVLVALLAAPARAQEGRARPSPRADTLAAADRHAGHDTTAAVRLPVAPPPPAGVPAALPALSPEVASGPVAAAPRRAGADADERRLAPADTVPPKRVATAVEQALLANVVVNVGARAFGGQLRRDMEISFATWARNLRLGWTWDEEGFVVNMFGHPYQGAMYFHAGRHNGLTYWESAPLVVLGAWTWEYLGESMRPSLNDFFTTTLSGVAFGEMSHRIARSLRDDTATGRERVLRELGAAVVSPVGAANRVLRGEAWRVQPNPPGRFPPSFALTVDGGARVLWDRAAGAPRLAPTVAFDVAYGDALQDAFAEPFDVFTARGQLSASGYGLEALETSGRLFQRDVPGDGRLRVALQASQRFLYAHNPSYSFGGQSIETAFVARYAAAPALDVHGRAGLSGFLLSGVSAPEVAPLPGQPAPRRSYDFGPGVGALLDARLVWHGMPVVALRAQFEGLRTVSGTPADHGLWLAEARAALPVSRTFGAGVHVSRNSRRSAYEAPQPGIDRASSQAFFYVTWTNVRRSPSPLHR